MYLLLFGVGALLELILRLPLLWRAKRLLIPIILFIVGAWTGAFLVSTSVLWSILVLIVSVFRIINLLKIYKNQINEVYLKRSTMRTSAALLPTQAAALFLSNIYSHIATDFIYWIVVTQIIVSAALILISIKNIKKTKFVPCNTHYSDKELPTVTVAVPARNEEDKLKECLDNIISSDYPKLEILVLDDCSSDSTSEIIKGFAQKGVRFIKGYTPQERWLSKNLAYDKLTDESSGEYIIFCSADVRMGRGAITTIVTRLLEKKKKMICVLPRSQSSYKRIIISLRYWWELSLPRIILNRPAVLSDFWAIDRNTLISLGGFDGVSNNVIPEGYFARELIKQNQYSLSRANNNLDITLFKSDKEHLATEIRLAYPELQKRVENTLLITTLEILFLASPLYILITGLIIGNIWLVILSGSCHLILSLNNFVIANSTSGTSLSKSFLLFPVSVITQICINIESMRRYEFGVVKWKERNICYSVMHVTAKLPEIN